MGGAWPWDSHTTPWPLPQLGQRDSAVGRPGDTQYTLLSNQQTATCRRRLAGSGTYTPLLNPHGSLERLGSAPTRVREGKGVGVTCAQGHTASNSCPFRVKDNRAPSMLPARGPGRPELVLLGTLGLASGVNGNGKHVSGRRRQRLPGKRGLARLGTGLPGVSAPLSFMVSSAGPARLDPALLEPSSHLFLIMTLWL